MIQPLLRVAYDHGFGTPPPSRGVNETSQSVLTVGTWIAVAVIVVVGVRMSQKRATWVPAAMVLAAAVNSLNEPLFDHVFHMFWYEPHQWTLLTTFGYPQPVWVMSAYVIYFSVPGLYIYHRVRQGADRQFVWTAVAVTAAFGATFESIAIGLGTYSYFGPQGLRLLTSYPLVFGVLEGCHITIWALVLARFTPHLRGPRALFAVPMFAVSFCSVMYGAGGLLAGAMNVEHPHLGLVEVTALGSIALALSLVWAASFLLPEPSDTPAPVTTLDDVHPVAVRSS